MAIVRYTASADNTITNAFKEDLVTRGTGSNMGASDTLEVFSIYGQESSASAELSRAIIKFPATGTVSIKADRDAGTIPAAGNVNFFLKMYNVAHTETLPIDYKMTVARITAHWEEGYGLDMDNYTDLTYDGFGSNWINATNTTGPIAEITSVQFTSDTNTTYGAKSGANSRYIVIYNKNERYNVWFNDGSGDIGPDEEGADIEVNISGLSTSGSIASKFQEVMDAHADFSANVVTDTVFVTASLTGPPFTGSYEFGGISGTGGVPGAVVVASVQSGSNGGLWGTVGGDFTTSTSRDFVDVTFSEGDEDIEADITDIVEDWIKSSSPNANYGLMLKLTSSQETYFSSSTGANSGSLLHNLDGAKRSYYTKKFSARGTEFFFKRPVIEARWDDSRRDNRGDFYFSSSLVPAADSLNTLYMYNYVRGKLEDLAGNSVLVPTMKLYHSSGSVPEGLPLTFKNSSNSDVTSLAATRVSKGVYSATFGLLSSSLHVNYPYLVDVWEYSSEELHTGSAITPKTHSFSEPNPNSKFVLSVSNMRDFYNPHETARFRVFIREKDWSPTLYTKATNAIEAYQVVSASYEIYRVVDEEVVIAYGTGSSQHTRLSYDVSGNYFDLSMKLLEPGYMYGIRISIYEDSIGSYREQPYTFKFKVKRHYDDY